MLDNEQFAQGYRQELRKHAGGFMDGLKGFGQGLASVGNGIMHPIDTTNNSVDSYIGERLKAQQPTVNKMVVDASDKAMENVGNKLTKKFEDFSHLDTTKPIMPQIQSGAKGLMKNTLGVDMDQPLTPQFKTMGENALNTASQVGSDLSRDPMGWIGANPGKSILGAGAALLGGYGVSKLFGGGDSGSGNGNSAGGTGGITINNNTGGGGGGAAYTTGYKSPQALQKSSADYLIKAAEMAIPMKLPEAKIPTPGFISTPLTAGIGLYNMLSDPAPSPQAAQTPQGPEQFHIDANGKKAEKLLQNKRIQEYLTSILRNPQAGQITI